jgi:predicted nicotinamide N-methyase
MDERLLTLRAEIDAIGPLIETGLDIALDAPPDPILQPEDMDALLDGAADDPEQNLPYWAELWPSGIALARAIAREPDMVRDERVLEVGSGLGVTAAAALRAGANLIAADYSPESLLLCRFNALRIAAREPETIQLNWRQPSPNFLTLAGNGFPIVLAADVLYESRDVEPMLQFMARTVAPGGLLWLAEPGRPPAARFLSAAEDAGWSRASTSDAGPWPDPKDAGVVVGLHKMWRR